MLILTTTIVDLQGYATRNAQIDSLEGYHLVFYASTYEPMPHLGYQNPYSYKYSACANTTASFKRCT
jgi:hypothetical protein